MLFKGSSFTTETSKLYIFNDGDKIAGELGDKNRHNTDNFICVVSDKFEGAPLSKPLPINFDSFRLLSFNGCREVGVRVNQDMGVIACDFKKDKTSLIYVISSLIN